MKKMKALFHRINNYISLKYMLIYFVLMAAVYVFSLFGSMFGGSDFTYADF